MSSQPAKTKTIEVHVAFPIAPAGPFHEKFGSDATAGQVREAAMAHFGVAEDGQHAYYLTHDGAKVADNLSLKEIAGRSVSVKFTLVKELIQG